MRPTIDLETACKLTCYLCAEGQPASLDVFTGRYYHKIGGEFYNAGFCRANNLRKFKPEPSCECGSLDNHTLCPIHGNPEFVTPGDPNWGKI
jgi:hypothetical protein